MKGSKKKKLRLGRVMGLTLGMIVLVLLAYSMSSDFFAAFYKPILEENSRVNPTEEIGAKLLIPDDTCPGLKSQNAILVRLSDQQILLDVQSQQRIYPASMSKIMTALVGIEQTADLRASAQLPKDIFTELYAANASMAGFQPGEKVQIRDLLYGVLLPSGAEASLGLAVHVAGSEANFVAIMNKKAQELGLKNTHYVNVSGLHNENHYTTAQDMQTLLTYALQNDVFRQVFTTERYTTSKTKVHPQGITLNSTLFSKMISGDVSGGGKILGGKTGYTEEAGQCLASLAIKDGQEYILITAKAQGDSKTEQLHIDDALRVYGIYFNRDSPPLN